MAPLNRERWQVLEPLLDQALELSAEEQASWLQSLHTKSPGLADELISLLAGEDAANLLVELGKWGLCLSDLLMTLNLFSRVDVDEASAVGQRASFAVEVEDIDAARRGVDEEQALIVSRPREAVADLQPVENGRRLQRR